MQMYLNSDYYELEDKIFSNGFSLVGSEPFPVQAVCFYCGSAGQKEVFIDTSIRTYKQHCIMK